MLGYVLLLTKLLVHKIEGISIKKYNSKHQNGGALFTAIISLFSMLFFVGCYIFDAEKGNFTPKIIPYAVVAGVLYCSASVLTYVALELGSYAVTMFTFSFSTVLTAIYSIVYFKEPCSALKIIGLVLLVPALFFFKQPKSENDKKSSFKWLIAMIISLFCSAGYGFMVKLQMVKFNNTVSLEFQSIALGVSALALLIVGFFQSGRNSVTILKNAFPYASLGGISNGLTNLLSLFVLAVMPLSVSGPVGAVIDKVITLSVAFFVFRERLSERQIIGLMLYLASGLLVNF